MVKRIATIDQECCSSVVTDMLDVDQAAELAGLFAALADPVRLRIFNCIARAEETCSCELVDPLGKAQPTISHHTKILQEAGLIAGEKRGKWVYWKVVPERLDALRGALR
jgi:ArsR family transcriptional regulator